MFQLLGILGAFGDLLPASISTYGGDGLTSIELSHYEESQKKLPRPSAFATPLVEATTFTEGVQDSPIKFDDCDRSDFGGKETKQEGQESGEEEEGGKSPQDNGQMGDSASGEETISEPGLAVIVDFVTSPENENPEVAAHDNLNT